MDFLNAHVTWAGLLIFQSILFTIGLLLGVNNAWKKSKQL